MEAVQDSPLADQYPCSSFQKPGRKSTWKSPSHPSSDSGPGRCWSPSTDTHTSPSDHYHFSRWVLHLPEFPSCHMMVLDLAGSGASRDLSPHVLLLHKGSLPRSDIAPDPTRISGPGEPRGRP
ncbi:unnamed protein product [Rangifer tarandus platyrhynchus]|uniref:Uncharacterized protein n=2 Tax=Rangifer tarandus platyrhynchus TaxID=3082113 RepID=A0ABN8ZLR0_RANTA|nr:unnamed protein product [Rangifer tarandus platyrhynchus]